MAFEHPPLHRAELEEDPLTQFQTWFETAAAGLALPEAAALATAQLDGRPSLRMVLVKGWDERGFRIFTNYQSRKGRELEGNPRAALLFHWPAQGRQVRLEGRVTRLSANESDEYFRSRPRGSQISAAISEQSRPIADRDSLLRRVAALEAELGGANPNRPATWGGFVLAPECYEFWQQGRDRLHDRFLYKKVGDRWELERLQP